MFTEKHRALRRFLLGEGAAKEEKEERFMMGWRIVEEFNSIREEMKRQTMKAFVEALKASPNFKAYQVEAEEFLEVGGTLRVYKEAWRAGGDVPIFFYALEVEIYAFEGLVPGIRKQDESVPFEGDWRKDWCDLFDEARRILCETWRAFSEAWSRSEEEWARTSARWSDPQWIVNQHIFPRTYRMEGVHFYTMLLHRGAEAVAEDYVHMFVTIKDATEKYLDQLATVYENHSPKKGGRNNVGKKHA